MQRAVNHVIFCCGAVFFLCSVLLIRCNFSDLKMFDKKSHLEWLKLNMDEALPEGDLVVWVPTGDFETSSLIKVPRYPHKFKEEALKNNPKLGEFLIKPINSQDTLSISGVRNEQISAQIALGSRNPFMDVKVYLSDLNSNAQSYLGKEDVKVRLVQYLPVVKARSEYVWSPSLEEIIGPEVSGDLNPNVVADVLIDFDQFNLESYSVQPIWFTFKIPFDIDPGIYRGNIVVSATSIDEIKIPVELTIQEPVLPDPNEYKFHLDLWLNPSSIAAYYQVEHWSEKHWKLIKAYFEDYASRGGKNVATTITHEPWHKPWIKGQTRSQTQFGYQSMISWIKDSKGNWKFDYTVFDRYITLAIQSGIDGFINAFSVTPFHTKQKIKYWDTRLGQYDEIILEIEDDAFSRLWQIFLLDFKEHLLKKGWFKKTYLGFDEKPEVLISKIRTIIKKSAPEFLDRISIAGHPESSTHAQNLSISYMFFPDQPLEEKASQSVSETIQYRNLKNKTTTFYLCAEPAHPNTLTFSPAMESRMVAWIALKYNIDGYLRWSYNNWTKDPFNQPVFLHTQGDDYYVYPGKNGPISSIRWELLKEGIEDFELFKIIQSRGEINSERLNEIIELATRNQDARVKDVDDFIKVRHMLLSK